MAGGINFNFEYGADDARKRKRQQEAAVLAQQLLDKGASPDAVNSIASNYAATGNFQVPEFQTKELPPTDLFPSGIPAREPFSLDKKKPGLFGFDAGTGKFTDVQGQPVSSLPDDLTSLDVKSYNSVPKPKAGTTHYINRLTGEEIRNEPNTNGKDVYTMIDPEAHKPTGNAKDPQADLSTDVIKKYQSALLRGEEIPDETMDSVRSAADYLNTNKGMNINLAEVQKDPSALDSVLGAAANVVNKVTGKKTAAAPAPKFGGSSVRFQSKAGKPLTVQARDQFINQATKALPAGTPFETIKQKARELATQANYTF